MRKDGLKTPQMELFKRFKDDVEAAAAAQGKKRAAANRATTAGPNATAPNPPATTPHPWFWRDSQVPAKNCR